MGLRILVVDDAAFVRDTIKRTLRHFVPEAEIFEAADGRRAVSSIRLNNIQLVLSDWEMPEMNGAELLSWLRESEYKDVPFLMITSRGDREHVVEAVQSGVSDFLNKPFTPEELQRKVTKQLKLMGYTPKARAKPRISSDNPFASAEVLTSASVSNNTPTGKTAKPQAATQKKNSFTGKAHLRFPSGTCECAIQDLTKQGLSGLMTRPEKLPTLFEQAVVDLEDTEQNAIAAINGYVHAMVAAENRADSSQIRINIRFVDNDPEKFAAISKAMSKG